MNRLLYSCINYNDEEYAKTLLVKVKGISNKTANRILEAVDGDISQLSDLWNDTAFWKELKGSKRWLTELKNTVGSMMSKDKLVKQYGKYGIGYPQIDMLVDSYIERACKEVATQAATKLYEMAGYFQDYDILVVTGGTGAAWFDYFKEALAGMEDLEIIPGNDGNELPIYYANARGYYMSAYRRLRKAGN